MPGHTTGDATTTATRPTRDGPPRDDHPPSRSAGGTSTFAAFLANIGVALAKLVAWLFTGSASMLAEAMHSVADSVDQGLLLFGRHRSRRRADPHHPFGYGRERYFWSFVVAIVLFSAGALFALTEGAEKLLVPHELSSYPWTFGVLAVALLLESGSLRTAVRESRSRKRPGESWRGFVRRTSVPELAVVVLEDSGALMGLVLALAGTTLSFTTGNSRYDALGSIGIGVLLALIAFTLASEMKSMLIGEAAEHGDVDAICDAIRSDRAHPQIDDLRTELLGPDDVLVVGSIGVPADTADQLDATTGRIESRIRERVPAARLVYLRARNRDRE
jgi:cation diffusion facilitator family transporter